MIRPELPRDRRTGSGSASPRFTTFPPADLASQRARQADLITALSVGLSVEVSATPMLTVTGSALSLLPGDVVSLVFSQTRSRPRRNKEVDSRNFLTRSNGTSASIADWFWNSSVSSSPLMRKTRPSWQALWTFGATSFRTCSATDFPCVFPYDFS